MHTSEIARMTAAFVGTNDTEIIALEAQLRGAQLAGDVQQLNQLIDDDLLFTGPDGQLGTKAQDLAAHGSGALRFREHEPDSPWRSRAAWCAGRTGTLACGRAGRMVPGASSAAM